MGAPRFGIRRRIWRKSGLHVEAEDHHVAVLHDVVLALHAEPAGLARAGLAAERHVVVIADRLGLDEAALEVGVDDTCGLGGLGTDSNRPGADLLGAGGEEALQAEQLV